MRFLFNSIFITNLIHSLIACFRTIPGEGCAGCDSLYVPRLCELMNSANDPNNVCFMIKPEAEALSQYYTSVGCMEAKVITNGEYSAVERADGQLYGTNPVQTEQLQVYGTFQCTENSQWYLQTPLAEANGIVNGIILYTKPATACQTCTVNSLGVTTAPCPTGYASCQLPTKSPMLRTSASGCSEIVVTCPANAPNLIFYTDQPEPEAPLSETSTTPVVYMMECDGATGKFKSLFEMRPTTSISCGVIS